MISTSTKNIYSLVDIKMKVPFSHKQVLSCKALKIVADLHLNFNDRRLDLLTSDYEKQNLFQPNKTNRFFSELRPIRNDNGRITDLKNEFEDRRIEMISPAERDLIKESISINSKLLIIDFNETLSPTWELLIESQINLKDAINNILASDSHDNSDSETMVEKIIPLMVRPRSLQSNEKNFLIDNKPVSAAFFDLGLYLYHNAKKLVDQGFAPYFYLPEIGNHLEANLWDDIFGFAEEELNLQFGTIKAAS